MTLSAKAIELAKPTNKEYLLLDDDKLYLRVRPNGSKSWLFSYRNVAGKRIKITLGTYPRISLALARDLAEKHRLTLELGKDPRQTVHEERAEARRHAMATFEVVGREWHTHTEKIQEWSDSYSQKIIRQLELHVFPRIGRHAIGSLNQLDVLQCLEAISLSGTKLERLGWHGGWGMGMDTARTTVRTNEVGTLVVDMFDLQSKRAVWRGTVSGTIPSSSEKLNQGVQEGITKLFEAFPPGSGMK